MQYETKVKIRVVVSTIIIILFSVFIAPDLIKEGWEWIVNTYNHMTSSPN